MTQVQDPVVRPPAPGGSAGRRISLITIDQGLSSASNLLIVILVAHALTAADFGRFSLLFVVYTLAQAGVRSLVSLPAIVYPQDADERPTVVLGAAMWLGLLIGGTCVAVGLAMWTLGEPLGESLVALGACLAFLLLQDVGRYLAIARGRPRGAIVLDTMWLVLLAAGFVVAQRLDALQLVWLVVVWGGSGAASSLWVFVQYGLPRTHEVSLAWVRERWDFAWRNLIGSVTSQSVGLLGASLAAAVSSPTAVAAIRGSLLIGRPSTAVHLGVGTSTAADVAREAGGDRDVQRHQRRAFAICMAVAIVNLAVLLFLPDALGRVVLGSVWPLIEPLLLATGLFGLAAAAQTGVSAVMVGRREMKIVMTVDIVGATVGVVCLVVGAAMAGASGAVWGTVVGQALATTLWWVVYVRYMRRRRVHKLGRHRLQRGRGVDSSSFALSAPEAT